MRTLQQRTFLKLEFPLRKTDIIRNDHDIVPETEVNNTTSTYLGIL